MITTINIYNQLNEYRGLSTDTKPTPKTDISLQNGATFFEMDTTKVFMFDKKANLWREI